MLLDKPKQLNSINFCNDDHVFNSFIINRNLIHVWNVIRLVIKSANNYFKHNGLARGDRCVPHRVLTYVKGSYGRRTKTVELRSKKNESFVIFRPENIVTRSQELTNMVKYSPKLIPNKIKTLIYHNFCKVKS